MIAYLLIKNVNTNDTYKIDEVTIEAKGVDGLNVLQYIFLKEEPTQIKQAL